MRKQFAVALFGAFVVSSAGAAAKAADVVGAFECQAAGSETLEPLVIHAEREKSRPGFLWVRSGEGASEREGWMRAKPQAPNSVSLTSEAGDRPALVVKITAKRPLDDDDFSPFLEVRDAANQVKACGYVGRKYYP